MQYILCFGNFVFAVLVIISCARINSFIIIISTYILLLQVLQSAKEQLKWSLLK